MDAELATALIAMKEVLGDDLNLADDLAGTRANMAAITQSMQDQLTLPDNVMLEEIIAPSSDGHEIAIRILRPKQSAAPMPLYFFIHGGGFVLGSAAQGDVDTLKFASELGMFTASVEYRLAPETPYPGPLMDCVQALQYLVDHADRYSIDPQRIIISGVSAGGGLAAGLGLYLRDKTNIKPVGQVLIFPMLDDTNIAPASDKTPDTDVWSRASNLFGWQAYLGAAFGQDDVEIYAAPSRAQDLSNLPPAIIPVGDLDLFLSENKKYAEKMQADGSACDLRIYKGAYHGFNTLMPEAAISQRANQDIFEFVQNCLKKT
ncbi:MAG: alpha/beta hydrolase [Parvibaculales bacterium]